MRLVGGIYEGGVMDVIPRVTCGVHGLTGIDGWLVWSCTGWCRKFPSWLCL